MDIHLTGIHTQSNLETRLYNKMSPIPQLCINGCFCLPSPFNIDIIGSSVNKQLGAGYFVPLKGAVRIALHLFFTSFSFFGGGWGLALPLEGNYLVPLHRHYLMILFRSTHKASSYLSFSALSHYYLLN